MSSRDGSVDGGGNEKLWIAVTVLLFSEHSTRPLDFRERPAYFANFYPPYLNYFVRCSRISITLFNGSELRNEQKYLKL